MGMGTAPLGLPSHTGDTAPGPFVPQLREGGGQRAAESLRSHYTGVKVLLLGDVAASGRSTVCESQLHWDPQHRKFLGRGC